MTQPSGYAKKSAVIGGFDPSSSLKTDRLTRPTNRRLHCIISCPQKRWSVKNQPPWTCGVQTASVPFSLLYSITRFQHVHRVKYGSMSYLYVDSRGIPWFFEMVASWHQNPNRLGPLTPFFPAREEAWCFQQRWTISTFSWLPFIATSSTNLMQTYVAPYEQSCIVHHLKAPKSAYSIY